MSITNYNQLQRMRESLIEEINKNATVITVEHLKLAEMRLQTVIMANLNDKEVNNKKIEENGKK